MTRHARLAQWVDEVSALCQPDRVHWCDGSPKEYQEMLRLMVQAGTAIRMDPARPNSVFVRSDPGRRGPRRGPHVHLLGEEGRCRTDQQLGRPSRDEGDTHGPLQGLDEGPHAFRDSLQHGPDRIAHREDWRGDHRFALRRCQHAHHDPRRQQGDRGAWRRRRVRQGHALGRRAARGQQPRRAVAVQRQQQVHLPFSRDSRDLVVRLGLRWKRPARQEVPRAPDRVGAGARRGLARRAHADPQADQPAGRGALRDRRLPVGVRQDQSRHAGADGAGLEGRDDRRRYRLDEVRAGRPALRHQPRGGVLRRGARHQHEVEPERDPDAARELHLHQLRDDSRMATCGGRP